MARRRKPTSSLTWNKWQAAHSTQATALLEGAVLPVMQGKEGNQMWPWKNDMYLHENPRPSFSLFNATKKCPYSYSLKKIIHNYIAQSSYKNEQKRQVRKATDIRLELDSQHSIILVLKIAWHTVYQLSQILLQEFATWHTCSGLSCFLTTVLYSRMVLIGGGCQTCNFKYRTLTDRLLAT